MRSQRLGAIDAAAAHAKLAAEAFPEALGLRDYQKDAIRAVEGALANDARRVLVAMATGTGKTRTCLGLIYRLLKAGRVRRVLFVVDREFLATQAAETFKRAKVEEQKAFGDLVGQIADAPTPEALALVHADLLAKLAQKFARLPDAVVAALAAEHHFDPVAVVKELEALAPADVTEWWKSRAALVASLDKTGAPAPRVLLTNIEDFVVSVEQSTGAVRPEEYLDQFGAFLAQQVNLVPALLVVLQRPRDLTRAVLKEVRAALDAGGYREADVQAAWKLHSNADIAAGIIGFIRQRALGSPLVAYELRVEAAVARVLAGRAWTNDQRRWIERIARQLNQETVVDVTSLDQGGLRDLRRREEGQRGLRGAGRRRAG